MPLVSYGFSGEADYVANAVLRGKRHLQRSHALGSDVLDELATVWEDCRLPNWDGFQAIAISQETLRRAYCVLESLPPGFPAPSVGAEPDGAVTFEWYRSPRYVLSVSVDETNDLHYAALLGPNRQFGTEFFDGELPERIQSLVFLVCGA